MKKLFLIAIIVLVITLVPTSKTVVSKIVNPSYYEINQEDNYIGTYQCITSEKFYTKMWIVKEGILIHVMIKNKNVKVETINMNIEIGNKVYLENDFIIIRN